MAVVQWMFLSFMENDALMETDVISQFVEAVGPVNFRVLQTMIGVSFLNSITSPSLHCQYKLLRLLPSSK